jgi:hypothetical protein
MQRLPIAALRGSRAEDWGRASLRDARADDDEPRNAETSGAKMSFEHTEKNRNLREWFGAYPLGLDSFGAWIDALVAFLARTGVAEKRIGKHWVPDMVGPIGMLIRLPKSEHERRLMIMSQGQAVVLKEWGADGKGTGRRRRAPRASAGPVRRNSGFVGSDKRTKGQGR